MRGFLKVVEELEMFLSEFAAAVKQQRGPPPQNAMVSVCWTSPPWLPTH
jgi:hypothetical protein